MTEQTDRIIIGGGAAGLMAGIWAGRTNPRQSIVILDGAAKLGAKILVAGGGRCNVTHASVEASAFAGSTRPAIAKVLKQFPVSKTVAFFRDLGVELKEEETRKLFPVSDDAHTVLEALLRAAHRARVDIRAQRRVERIEKRADRFLVSGPWGQMACTRLVLATGGKSLPKTGSDGHGYELANSLGHTVTPDIFPALVPLTLPGGHYLTTLSGITVQATVYATSSGGKVLARFTDSILCTHFGLSGPGILDSSRYYLAGKIHDPNTQLIVHWLPEMDIQALDLQLQSLQRKTVGRYLEGYLPDRLVAALCDYARVSPGTTGDQLTREQRHALTQAVMRQPLPITGSRGFTFAEVTAGGVPLTEIALNRMESRVCPGLYLCGEICDVDGRIGGFNFQWAWASGYVAGVAAGSG